MKRSSAVLVAAVALAVDMIVYGMAVPVLPRIAADEGASASSIGVLFAVYAAALLVATPFVGRMVDRVGPRTPLLLGLIGLAAATLLFAFAPSVPLLMAARALQGAAAAVSWVAGLALIAASYPSNERGKPMGIAFGAVGVGVLLGPPLGGLLADWFGNTVPFLVAAGLALGDGVLRLLLVRDVPHVPREEPARLWRHPLFWLLASLTGLGAALIAFPEPILPLHLAEELGASPGTVGLIFGGAVLVGSAVAPSIGGYADRLPRAPMAVAGALVSAVGLVLLGRLESVWWLAVALAVVVVGAQLVLVPTLAMIAELADSRQPPAYGAAYALYSLAYTGGLAVAPLAAGTAMSTVDFGGAVNLAAGAAVVIGLLVWLVGRAKERAAPPVHAGPAASPARSEETS